MDIMEYSHLKDMGLPDTAGVIPEILIGEDNVHVKIPLKVVICKKNDPIATLTPLGWAVHGPFNAGNINEECVMLIHQTEEENISLQMKKFWSVESFGVDMTEKALKSKEEQLAEEMMENTARRQGNRWETGLLWKTDEIKLPESRKVAENRFLSLEKKLSKDKVLHEQYMQKIDEYCARKYARILTAEEEKEITSKTRYLPHFIVSNPHKPGKIRLVWDAAAKSQGVSLNDNLLKGPDLFNSLIGILSIFRERPIVLCGDLKEMFHQIRIRHENQGSQRFLGRDKQTGKLITLQMEVMIFGAVSSPYVAQEIKNRNAEEFKTKFSETCQAIIERHYMDDYLDSVDTVEEAIFKAKQVSYIHEKGGFEIRNWMSNSTEVLASLPADTVAPRGSQLNIGKEEFTRVLGVTWSPESDYFSFSVNFPRVDRQIISGEKRPSKREVLKLIMPIFDPLGLLSVVTIRGKILMQDVWRSGLDWDFLLPEELTKKWTALLGNLQVANKLRIPRCYAHGIGKLQEIQLHVFCDASTQAFAAAGYFRLEGETGVQVTLVMSKSRVAPLKPLTIPRLELQAAVMGSRLAEVIKSQHTLKIKKTYFWTDSSTVINWIKSDARKYQPFVAHRLAEILDLTSIQDWKWILTGSNVADEVKRDVHFLELSSSSTWFTGPDFLQKDESEWPVETVKLQTSKEAEKELKREFVLTVNDNDENLIDFTRFSSSKLLVCTMARVLRFVKKRKNQGRGIGGRELTADEILCGEREILKMTQKMDFAEELKQLKQKKSCYMKMD